MLLFKHSLCFFDAQRRGILLKIIRLNPATGKPFYFQDQTGGACYFHVFTCKDDAFKGLSLPIFAFDLNCASGVEGFYDKALKTDKTFTSCICFSMVTGYDQPMNNEYRHDKKTEKQDEDRPGQRDVEAPE